jgi:hypothetical protein
VSDTVNLTIACDTRLARVLVDALRPLVEDGSLDVDIAMKIVASAVRIATVQHPELPEPPVRKTFGKRPVSYEWRRI